MNLRVPPRAIGERIALTLWVGSLWAVGYVAAPVLFTHLEDRALAGRLAGEMFTATTFIGLACGGFLLLSQWFSGPKPRLRNERLWLVAVMLVLLLVGQFGVRGMMAAATGAAFMRLHGVAQSLYLLVSVLGLLLVALGPRSGAAAESC